MQSLLGARLWLPFARDTVSSNRSGAKGEGEMRSKFRVREATQTDVKREFERRGHTDWQWTMAALVAFSILDYLCMGLKVMK
jgi:hypothetical protein